MTWHLQAACIGHEAVMFPHNGGTDCRTKHCDDCLAALAICATCPVTTECLADVMDDDPLKDVFGVRGGQTHSFRAIEWERRRLRTTKRRLSPCGTIAAYERHVRLLEVPCEKCREARREKNRRDKQRYRARQAS